MIKFHPATVAVLGKATVAPSTTSDHIAYDLRAVLDANVVHWRPHTYPMHTHVRVWTDQQAAYGAFDVVTNDEFATLRRLVGSLMLEITIDEQETIDED